LLSCVDIIELLHVPSSSPVITYMASDPNPSPYPILPIGDDAKEPSAIYYEFCRSLSRVSCDFYDLSVYSTFDLSIFLGLATTFFLIGVWTAGTSSCYVSSFERLSTHILLFLGSL
jgi:hypothetical protein